MVFVAVGVFVAIALIAFLHGVDRVVGEIRRQAEEDRQVAREQVAWTRLLTKEVEKLRKQLDGPTKVKIIGRVITGRP